MGSFEKFTEAVAVFGQKTESLENVIGLIMHECAAVEDNSKVILDLSTQLVGELESKQKHPMAVVESVQASYGLLNSKKRWLEEGLEKLDERVKCVKGVSKEVEEGQVQSRFIRDSMDQQLKKLALKEKQFQHISDALQLTLRDVEERKNELDLMEKGLNGRKSEIELRQKELEARELEVRAKEEMLDKRQHEIDSKHSIVHPRKSGSDSLDNFALKPTVQPSSFSSDAEKVNQESKFNVGDVWSCFDSKDALPRSQAQVINIIEKDGKDLLKVKWLKPCPVYHGEKEWIDAGLPVTCGMFNSSGVSVVSPNTLCHPVSSVGEYPWIILPCEGETWAIYSDWDILRWSSNPKIHRNCKYDIVEILSYTQDSSSPGIKVAYLKKIEGSVSSFQRICFNYHSFLKRTSLYRLSHRVPSLKKDCMDVNGTLHCVFELDPRSLPEGLL